MFTTYLAKTLAATIALFIIGAGTISTYWNEMTLYDHYRSLIEIKNNVSQKNDLNIIYYYGYATTKEILQDTSFEIEENALKLTREVEMYQWEEDLTRAKNRHIKTWSNKIINSELFSDNSYSTYSNPNYMYVFPQTIVSKNVTFDNYKLSPEIIKKIPNQILITFSDDQIKHLNNKSKLKIQINGEKLFFGENPQTPNIGDLRVRLYKTNPQYISVIAQKNGNLLQPYQASTGESVVLIESGRVSINELIDHAVIKNNLDSWKYRLIILLVMCFGALTFYSVQSRTKIISRAIKTGTLLWLIATVIIFIMLRYF